MQLLVVSALEKSDIIGGVTAKHSSSPAGLHLFVCLFVFSFHLRKDIFVVQSTVEVLQQAQWFACVGKFLTVSDSFFGCDGCYGHQEVTWIDFLWHSHFWLHREKFPQDQSLPGAWKCSSSFCPGVWNSVLIMALRLCSCLHVHLQSAEYHPCWRQEQIEALR